MSALCPSQKLTSTTYFAVTLRMIRKRERKAKKKGTKSGAQPDDDAKAEKSEEHEQPDEEVPDGESQRKGGLLNEVARNRVARSAQQTMADLKQQMNLIITKGRAAAAELDADTDAGIFQAEVDVMNWRLDASRLVMNTENKGLDEARIDLARLKQQLGQQPASSGAQPEDGSAGASTAEAAVARTKAAPCQAFE